jgi:hypothetical protein
MRIAKVLVVLAALFAVGAAQAQEHVVVERHANPGGIVVRDTLGGALAGSAVSGLIIGYNMGIQNHSNYDWQRTLWIGAAIGAGVGLIWGIVDATSTGPGYASQTPLAVRDGSSLTLDRKDQSNQVMYGAIGHRF